MINILNNFASYLSDITNLYEPQEDLETEIAAWSVRVVWMSAIIVVVLVIISWLTINRVPKLKLPLFIALAGTMALSTLSLIGATVYLNTSSESGGPVHWHADFEIWACGNELELRDPTGLSNKIGTSTLHEHNDRRVHLEGVVVEKHVDASLGKFMYVTGGAITDEAMVVPLNPDASLRYEDEVDGDGKSDSYPQLVEPYVFDEPTFGKYAKFFDGQTCGDQEAEVQVFVYNYDEANETYKQTKLERPQDYVIYDDSNVPPGDCVIFEFDVPKEKTDKLCEQYGVRDIDRCEEFGVEPEERSICSIKQQDYDQNTSYIIEPEPEYETEEVIEESTEETPVEDSDVQGIQTYQQFQGELY